ncbi:MAG TPA: hypothetical protein VHZ76_09890 [Gammaproteobacteria bacterium]|nr:hypothetical protein [Gammaproteobacteria bacterium]
MQWLKISLCYYPTTIIVVDDEQKFLDELKLGLDDRFACKFYDKPEKVIEYFNNDYQFISFINSCLLSDNDQLDHGSQDLDLRLIRNEVYRKNRFSQPSVFMTDYVMPGKNGLVCCQLTPFPLIKILLTGQADNNVAVEAFNKGIIDKFIQKSAGFIEVVNTVIRELQIKYFINLSDKLYDMLPNSTKKCLTDPVFVDFFYALCEEKKIVEYYLTDESGSFLMLDITGKPSWLAIANDEQMESYYEIAHGHKDVPPLVMSGLKTKQMVPYFYTDDDLDTSAAEWERYLHPAKQLVGKEIYYYAYIDDPDAYEIDRQNIFSYQQFLQAVK